MPSLHKLLLPLTAAKEDQLIVFKEYDAKDVAEAVERLSAETGKPVQRVDLAPLVSKYLDQTEKALQAVLESAKSRDAILFFDEADALFGKRSDVKDAHDRYANRKAAYLLQKLEAYNGPVVVAVNKKNGSGKPFLRRYPSR